MKLYQIDLGVILLFIYAGSAWITSMLYNFTKAITSIYRNDDWRLHGYAFCGQVLATIVCVIGGFLIITR